MSVRLCSAGARINLVMELMDVSELTESELASEIRREQLLIELALTEDDLSLMGPEQRELVEEIISKVLKVREDA